MMENKESKRRTSSEKGADIFLFMGQSNMAGRGAVCERWPEAAPQITEGAGYEYRAVTAPDCLSTVEEPFGRNENRDGGIHDGDRKSGSMVTAFINAYYREAEMPVIGLSASKGGSSILEWQPGGAFLRDVEERVNSCKMFLESDGWTIRHTYMLWCQGETDGDYGMSGEDYQKYFQKMWQEMQRMGVEHCFLILIGDYNGREDIDYTPIQQAQRELPQICEKVMLVNDSFPSMKERGLMKDEFHYYQKAYNEVGEKAGQRVAQEVTNSKGDL